MSQLALAEPDNTSTTPPGNPTWLGDLRRARGLSQADACRHIGVTTGQLSMYESRTTTHPRDEIVATIADYYDIAELELRRWFGLWTTPRHGNPADQLARTYTDVELHHLATALIDDQPGLWPNNPTDTLITLAARRIWHGNGPAAELTRRLRQGQSPALALLQMRGAVTDHVHATLTALLDTPTLRGINRT